MYWDPRICGTRSILARYPRRTWARSHPYIRTLVPQEYIVAETSTHRSVTNLHDDLIWEGGEGKGYRVDGG